MDVTSVGMAERFPKEAGSKPNVRATLSEMTKLVFQVTRKWIKTLAATIDIGGPRRFYDSQIRGDRKHGVSVAVVSGLKETRGDSIEDSVEGLKDER